jgi:hypothetical protein
MNYALGQSRASLLTTATCLGMALAISAAEAQSFPPQGPPCPTSTLAPSGLNPGGNINHCPNAPNCLVSFAGYQWWTAYQFPFFNGGLQTPFAPEHASIGADGKLHLKVNNDINLGAGAVWAGGEAVLMFNADGTEANLGYGDYLVQLELVSPAPNTPWNALDPNVAFGVFTYENPATGAATNPNREIDLAEISRWGWNHKNPATCPIRGTNGNFPNDVLCQGDVQFALQQVPQAGKESVRRYDIESSSIVTLVMRWHDGNAPVTFEKFAGAYTLSNLPTAHALPWDGPLNPPGTSFMTTSPANLNKFIPPHTATSCERFHLNFWMGNYSAGQNPNPPPSAPQEAIVLNFQFKPFAPAR